MIVLAGPNGAGKSTLYETRVKDRRPDVEFVNPDKIAEKLYGRHPQTQDEMTAAQRLAEDRRAELMRERKSLVVESTFSHPSKLDLIRDAKAAGYEVLVHHVNVLSANISVARVANRVQEGGHPVPEDKIRERYERNQVLIRQAVKMADRAVVWDNSKRGEPPTRAVQFEQGLATWAGKDVPAWARTLYSAELEHFSQSRLNAPAASFAEAKQIVAIKDPDARVHVARPGRYVGTIVGETSMHVVQQLQKAQGATKASGSYVAHFKKVLDRIPDIGKVVEIAHTIGKVSSVTNLEQQLAAEALKLSLRAAVAFAQRLAGDKAKVEEAQRGKSYKGPVLAETGQHVIQGGRTSTTFIAHDKKDLATTPRVGQVVDVDYPKKSSERATVTDYQAPTKAAEREHDR